MNDTPITDGEMDYAGDLEPLTEVVNALVVGQLERENAELRKTLRSLRATFDTIHDRHYDNMDTVDGPDGQPKPNSDMHTVADCTVALDEIERVEPKSPPAQGTSEPGYLGDVNGPGCDPDTP